LRPIQPDGDRLQQQDNGIFVKSYLYLRLAIVVLLTALGVAVAYETRRLGMHPLASVSAYYYTPAQAIFVGALIGFAACMIALKGTTDLEDVFLNIGGMFAVLVAVVPTSRGADFEAAVAACQKAGPSEGDCPSTVALVKTAKLNIENNMYALLAVGVLVVLVTLLVWLIKGPVFSWKAFGVGAAVLVVVGTTFLVSRDWFISNAHWLAAVALFVCIFVVALENARRQKAKQSSDAPRSGRMVEQTAGQMAGQTVGVLISGASRRDHYTWIARIMLVVGGFAVWVWTNHWISLFLLELVVFALFIAFWIVQTIEQGNKPPGSEHIMENAVRNMIPAAEPPSK
jgi:hypothetical protein